MQQILSLWLKLLAASKVAKLVTSVQPVMKISANDESSVSVDADIATTFCLISIWTLLTKARASTDH